MSNKTNIQPPQKPPLPIQPIPILTNLPDLKDLPDFMAPNPMNQPRANPIIQQTSTTKHKSNRKRSLHNLDENVQKQIPLSKRQRLNHNQMRQSTNSHNEMGQSTNNHNEMRQSTNSHNEMRQSTNNHNEMRQNTNSHNQMRQNTNQSLLATLQIPNDNTNSASSSSNAKQCNENRNHNHNYMNNDEIDESIQINENHNYNNNNYNNNNHASKSPASSPKKYTPLDQISRWDGDQFRIKVKCLNVSDTRMTKKGTKWFSVIVMDNKRTEKKINFWSNVYKNHADKMQAGYIYDIYGLQTNRVENKDYQQYGDVDLAGLPDTKIDMVFDDNLKNLRQIWNFVNIIDIAEKKEKERFDVIGVVLNSKNIKSRYTRGKIISLADQKGIVEAAAWGKSADLMFEEFQVIALKNCARNDFMGQIKIKVIGYINPAPACPEADKLREWLKAQGRSIKSRSDTLSNISDGAGKIEDYTNIERIPFSEAVKMQKDYELNQIFPNRRLFKIHGIIDDIRGRTFFHKKQDKAFWTLRILIKDIETISTDTVQAICYEDVGEQIMDGYSGDDAADLQTDDPRKFARLMDGMINNQQKREFSMRCSETSYRGEDKKQLQFIVDEVLNC